MQGVGHWTRLCNLSSQPLDHPTGPSMLRSLPRPLFMLVSARRALLHIALGLGHHRMQIIHLGLGRINHLFGRFTQPTTVRRVLLLLGLRYLVGNNLYKSTTHLDYSIHVRH